MMQLYDFGIPNVYKQKFVTQFALMQFLNSIATAVRSKFEILRLLSMLKRLLA